MGVDGGGAFVRQRSERKSERHIPKKDMREQKRVGGAENRGGRG